MFDKTVWEKLNAKASRVTRKYKKMERQINYNLGMSSQNMHNQSVNNMNGMILQEVNWNNVDDTSKSIFLASYRPKQRNEAYSCNRLVGDKQIVDQTKTYLPKLFKPTVNIANLRQNLQRLDLGVHLFRSKHTCNFV